MRVGKESKHCKVETEQLPSAGSPPASVTTQIHLQVGTILKWGPSGDIFVEKKAVLGRCHCNM